MSEMPEYVLKELASKAVGEMVTALEQKARELDAAYDEIETLRMVANQAIDFANIRMEHQNWMRCCESSTYTANAWPELAAYLREREQVVSSDNHPPDRLALRGRDAVRGGRGVGDEEEK